MFYLQCTFLYIYIYLCICVSSLFFCCFFFSLFWSVPWLSGKWSESVRACRVWWSENVYFLLFNGFVRWKGWELLCGVKLLQTFIIALVCLFVSFCLLLFLTVTQVLNSVVMEEREKAIFHNVKKRRTCFWTSTATFPLWRTFGWETAVQLRNTRHLLNLNSNTRF